MNLSDLFFWKHKAEKHIIKNECYDKLPEHRKINYEKTKYHATHAVEQVDRSSEDDDGILLTALTTAAIVEMLDDNEVSHDMGGSQDSTPDTEFQGFGGGDTGGGGAGGDWSDDSSSDSSSYDSDSSSFDSDSSSFDSGSDSSW